MADLLGPRKRMKFFTEVVVPEGSPLIGSGVLDVPIFKRDGMRVIDVIRGDESLRRQLVDVGLMEGDRVVLRTEMQELLGLKDSNKVTLVDRVGARATTTVEALILPECRFVGRSLGSLRLRRRYGVYPLAVHRRSQNIGRKLDEVVVRVGDTLLLEGAPEDIRRLASDMDLMDVNETTDRPFKRGARPWSWRCWRPSCSARRSRPRRSRSSPCWARSHCWSPARSSRRRRTIPSAPRCCC